MSEADGGTLIVAHPDHRVAVRAWRRDDADALARHANHPDVSRFLRDRFPYPYSYQDAVHFLDVLVPSAPHEFRAIDVDGEAVGGIGIHPGQDVHRRSGELGYWLAPAFWRRGIMAAVVKAYVRERMVAGDLLRIAAVVYDTNTASARLLERCGFVREGTMRRAVFKHGAVTDAHLYAYVDEDAQ